MEEIWKDIKGYEGIYQISNLGRVRSLNYRRTGKAKTLKGFITTKGYIQIKLQNKHILMHRLVAEAFISNFKNYPYINHIDGNKTNNLVNNLEWCTARENTVHAYKNRLIDKEKKAEQQRKLLKGKKIRSKKIVCITSGEFFDSIIQASNKYNVSDSDISKCCKEIRKSAGRHPVTGEKLVWMYYKDYISKNK
ncbi:MAG TPA: hypothetical protein DDY58_01255 [Terrisporobacter glycolicus]|uniref:NUMOD4 domain-containing protein n=1 Tax=Terrisporobacter TaxID=1505652 RepID=UPI000E930E49|nr:MULTISPECIES: NUMOD4 domain-containing protein [Terrisporobacter]HBI91157.1 hypothetical protein [Terrisporobacter hibernicus]